MTGKIDTLQRANQLAQTDFSPLQRPPAAIADSINQVAGNSATLTQMNRYVTLDTPLGSDVLLVNVARWERPRVDELRHAPLVACATYFT